MDKFFEFSKAESNLVQFDIKTFDVASVVQDVIKSNQNLTKPKNLEVIIDVEELANKKITTDESVLKTALQNIFETSTKLTERGSITIKLFNPEMETVIQRGVKVINKAENTSYLQISIKDSGMGLKESELEGIFEPYSQIDKMNKKNFVRSISLGTVKTLVNRLHGTVWVQSEVMKGTTFNIILPVEKGIILEDE